jgi:fucose permease
MGLFVLSFFLTSGIWRDSPEIEPRRQAAAGSNIFVGQAKFRRMFAAYCAFGFSYSSLEVAVPLWGATMLHDVMGASLREAGMAVTVFWIAFTIGRLLVGIVRTDISDAVLIRCCVTIAAAGAAILAAAKGPLPATAACAVVGFGAGPIFPLITHDTPRRTGDAAVGRVIGVLVATNYAGAAILPAMIGYIAARLSIRVMCPVLIIFAIIALIAHEVSERNSIGWKPSRHSFTFRRMFRAFLLRTRIRAMRRLSKRPRRH